MHRSVERLEDLESRWSRFRVDSEISVGRGGEWVNGCSVLSILSLAAGPGTTLRVRARGADAKQAVRELGALLESPDKD